jgi:hypothetical protein
VNSHVLHTKNQDGKQKTEAPAIFLDPFVHCANGSLLFVRILTKKQMEGYPFANGLDGLAHLCPEIACLNRSWSEHTTQDLKENIKITIFKILMGF